MNEVSPRIKEKNMAKKESNSIKYSDLIAQIRNKQFAPVYLLHGEEPFFIDRLTKMFEEGILEPEERDFNQVVQLDREYIENWSLLPRWDENELVFELYSDDGQNETQYVVSGVPWGTLA